MLLVPWLIVVMFVFEDLVGNNGADAAADLGRLRQQDAVITARRDLPPGSSFLVPHHS